jgi:coenzyme F420 hydrogenase subunit beta
MNVRDTYENKLCCSCGVCEGICPKDAISLKIDANGFFKPEISNECIDCGICYKFCPGINYFETNESLDEKYVYGYSNNEKLRENAASGGIGTQLIMHLIEEKIVDYAVVVREGKNNEFEAIITNNLDQVYQSKGSKYCPVAIGSVLRDIRKMDAKFVIVGTPCKIHSLKRYFRHYKMEHKIKYYISLFCNNVPSYNATEYIVKMFGHKNLDKIVYRGGGWPGYVQIKEKNELYLYPFRKTMSLGFMGNFKSLRCITCADPFGRDADISLGDAYFIKESEDKFGHTFCIVRNLELFDVLNLMNQKRKITLKEGPSIEKIVNAYFALFNRKQSAKYLLNIMKKIGLRIPNNSPIEESKRYSKLSPFYFVKFKYIFLTTNLSNRKWLWKFLFWSRGGKDVSTQRSVVIVNDKF